MSRSRKVRKDYRALPVVVVTRFYTVEGAIEAIRAGASDYLPKPLDYTDLIEKLREALKRSRE